MRFGDRLRELRKEQGLSMVELGRILGLAESSISRYENNVRDPGGELVKRACIYFGVTSDYLLGLSDDKEVIILDKQKKSFLEEFDIYYKHLLNRLDKAMAYFQNHETQENSREYKAYEQIIKELNQLEDIKLNYDLFKEE